MDSYPEMNKKQQRDADRRARRYSENETSGIPQPLRRQNKRKTPTKSRMDRA